MNPVRFTIKAVVAADLPSQALVFGKLDSQDH
jgi:hypothetical protein